MARSRNLKPGFFHNEYLVELPAKTRLLFAGLPCIADRLGRLDDRPKKIKMLLFPADMWDVDVMLDELQYSGFILRYEVDGNKYIQIINFLKHQHPHKDEKESTIPAPCKHDASTVHTPYKHSCDPALTFNPITLTLKEHMSDSDEPDVREKGFEEIWKARPRRPNDSKQRGKKAYRARIREGIPRADLFAGVQRYAAYCKAEGTEPKFIKHLSTFLNADESWKQPWTVVGKVPDDEVAVARLVREQKIELPPNCKLFDARKIIARQTGMSL